MRKTIFISCGQYTEPEKRLGKEIAQLVRTHTTLEPFLAEEVQDLNGLDANILAALRDCVAFITVLHPRGKITRPDGTVLTRASIWIEQEIAIATYIQRAENRTLPIIVFKHQSVDREGIRDLLHLNPIEFNNDAEVLAELPKRLESWNSLKPSGIELRLVSKALRQQDGHPIRELETGLLNATNNRIDRYDLEVRLPSNILKHFNHRYMNEVPSPEPGLRFFRFDQSSFGAIRPKDFRRLASFEYCPACAVAERGGDIVAEALVSESRLGARAWVNGVEYAVERTIKQLAMVSD
jgi:hypothetical protein